MRIILDTDKKQIIVPWNYQQKLDEINKIAAEFGGENKKTATFTGYINDIWNECMKNSDKHVVVGQKPVRKK